MFGVKTGVLVQGSSAATFGTATTGASGFKSFTGVVQVPSGSTNVTATLLVEATNLTTPADHFVTIATITLSGSGIISDGFATEAPYKRWRGTVTAIQGTSAVARIYVTEF